MSDRGGASAKEVGKGSVHKRGLLSGAVLGSGTRNEPRVAGEKARVQGGAQDSQNQTTGAEFRRRRDVPETLVKVTSIVQRWTNHCTICSGE